MQMYVNERPDLLRLLGVEGRSLKSIGPAQRSPDTTPFPVHIPNKFAGVPGRGMMVGKGTPVGNPETCVQIPALSATDSVTSSKTLSITGTQYTFKKHMYVSPALGEDWGGTSRPEVYDYRCFYFDVFLDDGCFSKSIHLLDLSLS